MGENNFQMKMSKKSFFPPQHFIQKKISPGRCDLFEYNRAKWGTGFFIETTDKEVLATTKASKVSSKDVEMWAGS